MKKVFAFLSALALTFMLIATSSTYSSLAAEAAPGKWIIDPTLAEGEIPLYVGGSIATTFPKYFDIDAAKGTPYEDKAHRVGDIYPWNETKLIIPRYDEEGNIVGTYSVYPFGGNSANANAAGQNIYTWIKDEATGGFKVNNTHSFGSLSQIRYNRSGMEVVTMTSETRTNEAPGKGTTTAHVVFDGNGKATRGLLGYSYFEEPKEDDTSPKIPPQFGYVDGKVTKIVNGDTSVLDRIWVETDEYDLTKPLLDEFGNPIVDESGNPLYEKLKVEVPHFFYKRFLWQYFETKPENVNTVPYLQPGWLATHWDYYDEETKLAYLFLEGDDGKFGTVNQEQADVHNTSLGLTEGDPGYHVASITTRQEFLYIRVPVDGVFYDLGFIERSYGIDDYDIFAGLFWQAYQYGRTDNYQMRSRAYNFSAKPIELVQTVQDGKGYMPLPGTNYYEVLPNTAFKPSWVVNISGMLGGFTDLNDIFSYKNLPESELKIEVSVNGKRVVYDFFENIRYRSKDEMSIDFLTDFYNYLVSRPTEATPALGADVDLSDVNKFIHGEDGTGFDGTWVLAMQDYVMWENNVARPSGPDDSKEIFILQPEYYDKWIALFDVFDQVIKNYSGGAGLWATGAYTPTRRVNLYIQNTTLGEDNLKMTPEGWIYKPHEYLYETFNDMVTDFLTDYYEYLKGKEYVNEAEVSLTDFIHGVGQTEGFNGIWKTKLGITSTDPTYGKYPLWGHYEAKPDASSSYFFGQYAKKWMWLLDHYETVYVEGGVGAAWWTKSSWTPVENFMKYLLGNLSFTGLEDKGLFAMPIYVRESGYQEILPPAFRDMVIDTKNANINTRYVVDYTVYNKATGLSSTKQVIFVVVDGYTPLLEINQNALFVSFNQKTIDLSTIAKAYDRNYDKLNKDIKGWDISQNIVFDYAPSFDPNNLTPGKHEVKISITSGSKTVFKRVYINVPDTTPPVVETRDLYLPYGADFNPVDGIKFAYDNLDGNLFNAPYRWYVVTEGDGINTKQPGTYTVKLEVVDRAGNTRIAQYTVYVSDPDVDSDEIIDSVVDELEDQFKDLKDDLSSGSNCQSASATYFISIISALSIALFIFRKKQQ